MEIIRFRFLLVTVWFASLVLIIAGCTDTMVIQGSEPVRVIGKMDYAVDESHDYWIEIAGARIHVDVLNKVTLSSQARVAGFKVEGSHLGHYELGSSPFVIGITFDLSDGVRLTVKDPVLVFDGEVINGRALTPDTPSDPFLDCIDQINGRFKEIHTRNGLDKFCIRYEFPLDPVHPEKSFSVDFGVLEMKDANYPLRIEFEGVKRAIRTSL